VITVRWPTGCCSAFSSKGLKNNELCAQGVVGYVFREQAKAMRPNDATTLASSMQQVVKVKECLYAV